jgi:hypothetical protein
MCARLQGSTAVVTRTSGALASSSPRSSARRQSPSTSTTRLSAGARRAWRHVWDAA